ncbi:unnamed protein product [Owenia fusiformis]|uniref:Uncharacterized protein n=1 Tax=Owenia fusiformis TaxID=6347 RepID=A0A8J1TXN3_OWEFU|nr:unnamed protein product [Owenia fusiformis]
MKPNKINSTEKSDGKSVDLTSMQLLKIFQGDEKFKQAFQSGVLDMPPLLVVTSMGSEEGVDVLLGSGADPNVINQMDGNSPLILAARIRHVNIMKKLLEKGADPSLTNKDGNNAFMAAVSTGDAGPVNLLWQYRSKFNINQTNKIGCSALYIAASRQWESCLNMLVCGGANKNQGNNRGMTPLMTVALKHDKKSLDRLISSGANILEENNDGVTALCYAIKKKNQAIVDVLMSKLDSNQRMKYVMGRDVQLSVLIGCTDDDILEDEDSEESISYTLFDVLATLSEPTDKYNMRHFIYENDILGKLVTMVERYAELDLFDNVDLILRDIMFPLMYNHTTREIELVFMGQFMDVYGPEVLVGVTKKKGQQDYDICTTVHVMRIFIVMGHCAIGKMWLSENFHKVAPHLATYRDHHKHVSPSKLLWEPEILAMWNIFKVWFEHMHRGESDKRLQELIATEEHEKQRRAKKREKKKLKRRQRNPRINDDSTRPDSDGIDEELSELTTSMNTLEIEASNYIRENATVDITPATINSMALEMQNKLSKSAKRRLKQREKRRLRKPSESSDTCSIEQEIPLEEFEIVVNKKKKRQKKLKKRETEKSRTDSVSVELDDPLRASFNDCEDDLLTERQTMSAVNPNSLRSVESCPVIEINSNQDQHSTIDQDEMFNIASCTSADIQQCSSQNKDETGTQNIQNEVPNMLNENLLICSPSLHVSSESNMAYNIPPKSKDPSQTSGNMSSHHKNNTIHIPEVYTPCESSAMKDMDMGASVAEATNSHLSAGNTNVKKTWADLVRSPNGDTLRSPNTSGYLDQSFNNDDDLSVDYPEKDSSAKQRDKHKQNLNQFQREIPPRFRNVKKAHVEINESQKLKKNGLEVNELNNHVGSKVNAISLDDWLNCSNANISNDKYTKTDDTVNFMNYKNAVVGKHEQNESLAKATVLETMPDSHAEDGPIDENQNVDICEMDVGGDTVVNDNVRQQTPPSLSVMIQQQNQLEMMKKQHQVMLHHLHYQQMLRYQSAQNRNVPRPPFVPIPSSLRFPNIQQLPQPPNLNLPSSHFHQDSTAKGHERVPNAKVALECPPCKPEETRDSNNNPTCYGRNGGERCQPIPEFKMSIEPNVENHKGQQNRLPLLQQNLHTNGEHVIDGCGQRNIHIEDQYINDNILGMHHSNPESDSFKSPTSDVDISGTNSVSLDASSLSISSVESCVGGMSHSLNKSACNESFNNLQNDSYPLKECPSMVLPTDKNFAYRTPTPPGYIHIRTEHLMDLKMKQCSPYDFGNTSDFSVLSSDSNGSIDQGKGDVRQVIARPRMLPVVDPNISLTQLVYYQYAQAFGTLETGNAPQTPWTHTNCPLQRVIDGTSPIQNLTTEDLIWSHENYNKVYSEQISKQNMNQSYPVSSSGSSGTENLLNSIYDVNFQQETLDVGTNYSPTLSNRCDDTSPPQEISIDGHDSPERISGDCSPHKLSKGFNDSPQKIEDRCSPCKPLDESNHPPSNISDKRSVTHKTIPNLMDIEVYPFRDLLKTNLHQNDNIEEFEVEELPQWAEDNSDGSPIHTLDDLNKQTELFITDFEKQQTPDSLNDNCKQTKDAAQSNAPNINDICYNVKSVNEREADNGSIPEFFPSAFDDVIKPWDFSTESDKDTTDAQFCTSSPKKQVDINSNPVVQHIPSLLDLSPVKLVEPNTMMISELERVQHSRSQNIRRKVIVPNENISHQYPQQIPSLVGVANVTQAEKHPNIVPVLKNASMGPLHLLKGNSRWQPKSQLWMPYLQNIAMTPPERCITLPSGTKIERNSRTDQVTVVLGIMTDGTECAVKIIPGPKKDEYRTLTNGLLSISHRLQSDFLLQFKHYEEHCNIGFITMELCEESLDLYLHRILETHHAIDDWLKNRLIWQLLKGLQHLHDNVKVAHGNLKPQNILIDDEGRLKMSDYRLPSKFSAINTDRRPGSFGCNPQCWRSSEMLKWMTDRQAVLPPHGTAAAFEHTFNSDVQVAGMLVYYILTQAHPFGDNPDVIYNNCSRGWASITDLDEEASDLVMMMITFPPHERPRVSVTLRHPYFWAEDKRLRFLLQVGQDLAHSNAPEQIKGLLNSQSFRIMKASWCGLVHKELLDLMRDVDSYSYNASVVDLLRFIHSCCKYYQAMNGELQELLRDRYQYFTARFPRLLVSVYRVIKTTPWTERGAYKPFF